MFFSGQKGALTAAQNYTIDLAGIVGFLAGAFGCGEIKLYTPNQWKGSVPKSVTKRKFIRLYGEQANKVLRRGITDDALDAIMIAQHWMTQHEMGKTLSSPNGEKRAKVSTRLH
jgi:hypothetical protein